MLKNRGQIWVETVIYTLIGLALIGVILAFVTPKINQEKDKLVITQTIDALGNFGETIDNILDKGPGNIRYVEFTMKQGEMHINASSDEVLFVLSGMSKPYSEPDVEIDYGRVKVLTEENGGKYNVKMKITYSGKANLQYLNSEENKKFGPASTPYKFALENKGTLNGGVSVIGIEEVSGKV
jgi:type II secretory pathway pseudopilin PulG